MYKYLIVIEKAESNFAAYSPDVPGCVATGQTVEETLSEMKSALEFHFEDLDSVPKPLGLLDHFESGDLYPATQGAFITFLELNEKIAA